jgi:hypothetical protein
MAGFKVQDFKANVRELARQYQFQLEVVFPNVIGNSDLVNILVFAGTMPGRKVSPTSGLAFMGMEYKLAGAVEYPVWTARFRVDDNYDLIKKWRAWMELIHGTATNIASFPSQYKSNVSLFRVDNAGNQLIKITLNGVFPTAFTVTGLDTKSREPIEATVTLQYDFNTLEVL